MRAPIKFLISKGVLIGLILGTYQLARLPGPEDPSGLAEKFEIERLNLPRPRGELKAERVVHPRIERLTRWVSSSGSAVSVIDLNGDGLANEIILSEPRTDEILLYQAQRSGEVMGPHVIFGVDDLPGVDVGGRPVAYAPIGILASDLNADGFGDVLVFFMGRSPAILYQRPSERPWQALEECAFELEDLLDEPEIWNSNTAHASDLNGDTYLDVVIGNYGTDGIHYLDPLDPETGGRGPKPTAPASMSRAFNGGRNRFFCWMPDGRGCKPVEPEIVRLENGREVPLSAREIDEIAKAWTLAIATADLTGDMLPELYFANDFGPDRFFLNRSTLDELRFVLVEGERDLRTPRSKVLGQDSFKGMGVDFADVNRDEKLDIFVSNLTTEFAFEESHLFWMSGENFEQSLAEGRSPFREQSEKLGVARSHWAWDAKFADLNNDGVMEILQATGFVDGKQNRWARFHELVMSNDDIVDDPTLWPSLHQHADDGLGGNAANSVFVYDEAAAQYFDLAGSLAFMDGAVELGRGVAVADVDRDGDQDFVFSNQWQDSYLMLNHHHRPDTETHPRDFLGLDLFVNRRADGIEFLDPEVGWGGREPAIGAMVKVRAIDPVTGVRRYVGMDFVDGGNGYTGNNAPGVHVAVPDPAVVELEVELTWLSGPQNVQKAVLKMSPGYHAMALPISSGVNTTPDERIVATP